MDEMKIKVSLIVWHKYNLNPISIMNRNNDRICNKKIPIIIQNLMWLLIYHKVCDLFHFDAFLGEDYED